MNAEWGTVTPTDWGSGVADWGSGPATRDYTVTVKAELTASITVTVSSPELEGAAT